MLNSAILMGRLTGDPELRTTPNGTSVTSFTVAVERNYKNGDEKQTDFINCVAWRGTADFVSTYFKKGQMIALQGAIQTRNYEDKNGNKRTAVEVIVDNVSFCGGKNDNTTPKTETKAKADPSPYDLEHSPDFEPSFSVLPDDDGLPF